MVRSYKAADAEGVRDLILTILAIEYPFDKNAYGDSDIHDIAGTYSGEKDTFFIFEEANKILGTVGIKSDSKETALLRRLFVDPKQRRKGIGSGLIQKSIDFCKKKGYSHIVFRATDRMKDAIKLIKKYGFQMQESLEIAGFNIHIYRLNLNK